MPTNTVCLLLKTIEDTNSGPEHTWKKFNLVGNLEGVLVGVVDGNRFFRHDHGLLGDRHRRMGKLHH